MNFKIGIFGFLAAILLIVSCSKENIDITSEEEEEINTEVVNCDLSVTIVVDTIGLETTFTAVTDGGTAPFTYIWTSEDTTMSMTALFSGDYEVTVTDSEGCVAIDTFVTGISNDCNDFTGGIQLDSTNIGIELTAIANGGTMPYSYLWSTNETTQTIELTQAGEYSVLIMDALGCGLTYTYTTPDPCASLTATIQIDANSNFMWVQGSGGSGGYTFEWSTGQTIPQIQATESGTYTVTITDSQGCTATATIEVNLDPCSLFQAYIVQDSMSTALNANVFGGTNPYAYLWSNGETDDSIVGDVGSTYEITVTDAMGCITMDSYQVQ